ncbi:MAG: epoxide hydrolase [Chloroflexota bacterium]|nr:epoxide hydrolase [Chloroflexota bacterium]
MIEQFKINVEDPVLADLSERLRRTRWPGEIEGAGWEYGSSLGYVRELCHYWQTDFDWRAQERRLNQYPQFLAEIDGLKIHFVHVRGKGPNPKPLVLTHGWPSTFVELEKVITPLADPAAVGADPSASFDVVVPSLPGYGFSDQPRRPGMDPFRIAAIWRRLMTEVLGYERFLAHGGDWGAMVSTALGRDHADVVEGLHLHFLAAAGEFPGLDESSLSSDERRFLAGRTRWQAQEGAYSHQHGTRPQSLGYGLTDSPAGLAGWIVEKWRAWSDCGGDIESRFSKDELLTHLTIYWATNTIASSIRLYYERQQAPPPLDPARPIAVPTAFARFPVEISHPPREWVGRFFDLVRYTEMPRGGHFAASEEPELLAADIRDAFFGD